MKIKMIMNRNVAFVKETENLQAAARLMWEKDCGAIPVVDKDGCAIGIITDRDIAMAAYLHGCALNNISIKETMSKSVCLVNESDTIEAAKSIMRDTQIRRLPVVNNEKHLVGIISLNDLALEYKANHGKTIRPEIIADTLAAICAHRSQEKEKTEKVTA